MTIEDEQMRESGHQHSTAAAFVVREVVAFRTAVQSVPITPDVSAASIREQLASYTFDRAVQLDDAMRDAAAMIRRWTLHATHPRHFGLFVPGVHQAGILGDPLSALYDPQLGAWWTAPAANEIEIHTLKFLAGILRFYAQPRSSPRAASLDRVPFDPGRSLGVLRL
jgi:aromatic-L-amino-acid/L-tryptophan decarboxylase